jgi:hypothetical protein
MIDREGRVGPTWSDCVWWGQRPHGTKGCWIWPAASWSNGTGLVVLVCTDSRVKWSKAPSCTRVKWLVPWSRADRASVTPTQSQGYLLEFLGLAHKEFLINLKGSFMHVGWQLFSPNLLVEMEGIILIRWVALYVLASVWRRKEIEEHTRLPRLASPGGGWRGEAMGAQCACE